MRQHAGVGIICSRIVVVIVIASICIALDRSKGAIAAYTTNNYRDLDICNHWNGRRHFLELGERGDLHARNVTTSAFRSTLFASATSTGAKNYSSADIWYQCNLELVTCAECVIRITFTHVNFSKSCERNTNTAMAKASMCPCEHIQFSEPPYDSSISGQEFCGDGKVFRSKTRTLLLKLFYRATNGHVFSLQYYSERNVKIVSGSPKQSIISNYSKAAPQVISTPYFPLSYPRDYGVEHILTCEADNCQVRLDFTDFQLGLTSTLEIFDSNGQMLDSYTGEHFRPPITISSGKSLLLQFRGNGVTGAGFRAEITFVSSKQLKEEQLVPFTDCGGMVSGPGGAITMMNMIENNTDIRVYDCIWIIKPGNNYMMMKTHISLKVEEFRGMASRSELTIRQGTTSDAIEIENIIWPSNSLTNENHIVPILTGYYIRLRGVFGVSSKLAIVYSVFNYLNCYIGSEFLCANNHCISIRLHCDGFDHCGDGSDEPDTCEEDWAHLHNDRRWYSHKPNYYFPKIEQYPDLKTATGIFIISTLGIFAVLTGWMVILYRMGVRARHQRELQNHLQTISELLDRQEELSPDEPPSYEAPPDYEEVIKVGMEQEIREPNHRARRHHRRHRERSCSRASSNITLQSTTVPIHSNANNNNNSSSNGNGNGGGGGSERPSTSAAAACIVLERADACGENPPPDIRFDELANRVLMATAACGIAGASPSCQRQRQWDRQREKAQHVALESKYKSVGVSTSPLSLSPGSELSPTCGDHQRPAAASSCGTPTQLEECTDEFRDDSLNISLTLAIPHSSQSPTPTPTPTPNTLNATESNSARARRAAACTEQTYLKRSWVVIDNGSHNCKIQRLRHTYSSPDAFPSEHPYCDDILSYGTNLPHERSLFVSNASNFGSELSRDPSTCGLQQHTPQTALALACNQQQLSFGIGPNDVEPNDYGGGDLSMRLLHDEFDSDYENKISCFGAINRPFRVTQRIRANHIRHAYRARSKSFTNARKSQRTVAEAIKRSSSADLLINITACEASPQTIAMPDASETCNNDDNEPQVFLI